MTFSEISDKIKAIAAEKGGIGNSIKFATDQGNIFIDHNGTVTNEDREADATLKMDAGDLAKMMTGDLSPMTAFMFGKLKISGDMGVAMKLQSLF